jgi:ElaB/YqjD/DUF883 family membrane-anchored ribosome-binding protein
MGAQLNDMMCGDAQRSSGASMGPTFMSNTTKTKTEVQRLTEEIELLKEANRSSRRTVKQLRTEIGETLEELYRLREIHETHK